MANTVSADIVRAALAQMKPRPCLELYHGDWVRDDIAGCSLSAQGFWLRSMFVMHDAKPYGHMVGAAGEPLSDAQILKRIGAKNRTELNRIRSEIESVGVPGFSGDSPYREILNSADAKVTVRGTEWTLDLSPLSVTAEGVVYSRRMLRDRRLSLLRFFVSPKGQLLIPQTADLSTQTLSLRARAGAEDEEEVGSEVHSREIREGVQGEGSAPIEVAARLMPKLEAVGFDYPPGPQLVIAWLSSGADEKLIVETLVDVGMDCRGKSYRYFQKILFTRRDDPSQRPSHKRRGNGNGRSDAARGERPADEKPRVSVVDRFGGKRI